MLFFCRLGLTPPDELELDTLFCLGVPFGPVRLAFQFECHRVRRVQLNLLPTEFERHSVVAVELVC